MSKPEAKWIKTNEKNPRSFNENLPELKKLFKLSKSGYFGKAGQSKGARNIASKDPLATCDLFSGTASQGAVEYMHVKNGVAKRLKDGAVITSRYKSSSDGTPAVDINLTQPSEAKKQKIHFIKE